MGMLRRNGLGGYDVAGQGGTVRWVRTAEGLQAVPVEYRTVSPEEILTDQLVEAIEQSEARELEAMARLKDALARLKEQVEVLEKALREEG